METQSSEGIEGRPQRDSDDLVGAGAGDGGPREDFRTGENALRHRYLSRERDLKIVACGHGDLSRELSSERGGLENSGGRGAHFEGVDDS